MTWASSAHTNSLSKLQDAQRGSLAAKPRKQVKLLHFPEDNGGADHQEQAADPVNASPLDGRMRPLGNGSSHAFLKPGHGRSKPNHASNLLLLPSGTILCAWFWGEEGDSNVAIVMASLRPGAPRWEDLRLVTSQAGRSAQNPVLFLLDSGQILLIHTSQAAGHGQGTAEVRCLQSEDGGFTWTLPKLLFREAGAMVRNPLVRLSRGEWLLPVYYTPRGMGHVKDQYSVAKWSASPVSSWPQANTSRISSPGQGLVQPAIVRLRSGRLLALMRDRNSKNIFAATSSDEGRSWTAPRTTGLPNNNKAVMACTLPSGAVVLMFTNSHSWDRKFPVSIALSTDEGGTWPLVRDLQDFFHRGGCKGGCEYSYPSLFWAPGPCSSPTSTAAGAGSLHMSYTYSRPPMRRAAIRYVCANDPEAWIRGGAPSKGVYHGRPPAG